MVLISEVFLRLLVPVEMVSATMKLDFFFDRNHMSSMFHIDTFWGKTLIAFGFVLLTYIKMKIFKNIFRGVY